MCQICAQCVEAGVGCRLRHIYIDERRSVGASEGPMDEHSAMVMGNTLKEWRSTYDLNYRRRESQLAVDAMGPWRKTMLSIKY